MLSPDTVLIREDDEGQIEEWTPEPGKTQAYLWPLYKSHVKKLKKIAGRDEIFLFHLGDITQGTKYCEEGLPGVTLADQRIIAAENMSPLLELPNVKKARFITGTPVHVPDSAEARVAHVLAQSTGKDIRSYHHARVTIDGAILDLAHHGAYPGSRDWLIGNVALFHLRDRIYRDRRAGKRPADVYAYGHFHEWVHVLLEDTWHGETRIHHLLIVPSYCGLGGYGRKATRSIPTLTNGLAAIEIVSGRIGHIQGIRDSLDLRQEETL